MSALACFARRSQLTCYTLIDNVMLADDIVSQLLGPLVEYEDLPLVMRVSIAPAPWLGSWRCTCPWVVDRRVVMMTAGC